MLHMRTALEVQLTAEIIAYAETQGLGIDQDCISMIGENGYLSVVIGYDDVVVHNWLSFSEEAIGDRHKFISNIVDEFSCPVDVMTKVETIARREEALRMRYPVVRCTARPCGVYAAVEGKLLFVPNPIRMPEAVVNMNANTA